MTRDELRALVAGWPFARHRHECVTGRLTSHLWACRGWRCWGFPFRACRRHRGRGDR
jgi:hypothetical protein